jgi:hypothetical protein
VPTQHNGRSIYKPIETTYLHADSSDYGWRAVLNEDANHQARGFWSAPDRLQHITWKELRAVRHAVEYFLSQLRGRQVLLHEDNTVVVAALTKLTSRSPVMMTELRRLWFLLNTNDIHIRPRCIRSAANAWADTLSREMDSEDWQLNPQIFDHLQRRWGPHTIDRLASMLNAQLPRFNARWRDPLCEDIDCLHLSDAAWRRENNNCNPPWSTLPALAAKLAQAGYGHGHHALLEKQNVVPRFRPTGERNRALPGVPRPVLSRQARQARRGRTSRVDIVAFRLSPPLGSTLDAERLDGRYARTD